MGAGHAHDHGAGAGDHRGRLWIAFGLTAGMVLAQAVGSVLTGSLALLTDTVAALFIAALILPRAVTIMRETAAVLMEFTPRGLDLDLFREHIMGLHHVVDVHDVHASTVATGLPTISAHVVVEDECFRDGHAADLLKDVKTCVAEHFDVSVHHSTFQIETVEIRDSESHEVLHA